MKTRVLDYQMAVKLADTALATLLDTMPHEGAQYTLDVHSDMTIAFHYWLAVEHPDVLDALERQAEFEAMLIEDYIRVHSAAYVLEVTSNPADHRRIWRRLANE